MENETKSLLTRKEVAEKMRVSYPTLKRWADNGLISSIKIGGTIRYKLTDIEKLLNPKQIQSNG